MKTLLNDARLYLVLDTQVADYEQLFAILKQAVQAGVEIVQLRDKNGTTRPMCDFSRRAMAWIERRALFIVNDRLDVAMACGADGVHLGQDDLPLHEARALAGPEMIIGVSCQTMEHVQAAQRDGGADYIGFGSVFQTETKPGRKPMDLRLLTDVYRWAAVPVFAIGGITLENLDCVLQTGADRIAVTRAISCAPNIGQTVEAFQRRLHSMSLVKS